LSSTKTKTPGSCLTTHALLDNRQNTPELAGAIVELAALTGDALRDLDDGLHQHALQRLTAQPLDTDALRPLREAVAGSLLDASRVVGEPLPHGLQLAAPASSPSPAA